MADKQETSAGRVRPQTDRLVFGLAAAVAVTFVLIGVTNTASLHAVARSLLASLIHYAGWSFVLSASGFVLFAVWLALSSHGSIVLGRDGEKPEFSTRSWIAMMFSAGMGIGLIFYGVAEPVAHFTTPPPGTHPGSPAEAAQIALATSLFHWTFHPWAMFSVVGLALAYSTFRRGRSQLFSSAFEPLLGREHANGTFGKAVDVFAVLATLFGSAASLGLGALQISSGARAIGWASDVTVALMIGIIAVLTVGFVLSAVSGIAKGVQALANINMVLAMALGIFVFVFGPTVLILNLLPTSVAAYLRDLVQMAGRTAALGGPEAGQWLSSWTIFYWAWWVSWAPFVGLFMARISRGRTIREFVVGVIVVPSIISLLWFAIFGGIGIDLRMAGRLPEQLSADVGFFMVLQQLPISTITSLVVMFLVAIFFVSGADAASIVMGMLCQKGARTPTRPVVIFWGTLMGAVAAIMLLAGAGTGAALTGLQNLTILASAPFLAIMVGLCFSLVRDLCSDSKVAQNQEREVVAVETSSPLRTDTAVSDQVELVQVARSSSD